MMGRMREKPLSVLARGTDNTDGRVAGDMGGSIRHESFPFNDADAEAGQLVFRPACAFRVLGGFAAEQRRARILAALCESPRSACRDGRRRAWRRK